MMDQSVINLAKGKRQELRRISKILAQLKSPRKLRMSSSQALLEGLAVFLVDLGTKLKIEKSSTAMPSRKAIRPSSQG